MVNFKAKSLYKGRSNRPGSRSIDQSMIIDTPYPRDPVLLILGSPESRSQSHYFSRSGVVFMWPGKVDNLTAAHRSRQVENPLVGGHIEPRSMSRICRLQWTSGRLGVDSMWPGAVESSPAVDFLRSNHFESRGDLPRGKVDRLQGNSTPVWPHRKVKCAGSRRSGKRLSGKNLFYVATFF